MGLTINSIGKNYYFLNNHMNKTRKPAFGDVTATVTKEANTDTPSKSPSKALPLLSTAMVLLTLATGVNGWQNKKLSDELTSERQTSIELKQKLSELKERGEDTRIIALKTSLLTGDLQNSIAALDEEINTEIKPHTLDNLKRVANFTKDSVATVYVNQKTSKDKEGKLVGTGAAVRISPDLLLTSENLFNNKNQTAQLNFPSSDKTFFIEGTNIIKADKKTGLTLVKIPEEVKKSLPEEVHSIALSDKNPEMGDYITFSCPEGLGDTFRAGVVSNANLAYGGFEGAQIINTSVKLSEDDSGSPMFNMFGNLVGLAMQGEDGQEYVVGAKSIEEFLRKNGVAILNKKLADNH